MLNLGLPVFTILMIQDMLDVFWREQIAPETFFPLFFFALRFFKKWLTNIHSIPRAHSDDSIVWPRNEETS